MQFLNTYPIHTICVHQLLFMEKRQILRRYFANGQTLDYNSQQDQSRN